MSVTGPTKAELTADILSLLNEEDLQWYVNMRGKPDTYAPSREDVRRALMARTRDQLWNELEKLTNPKITGTEPGPNYNR